MLLIQFNMKNGGVNHGLVASRAFLAKNSCPDWLVKKWFAPSRMFFGLEMSHAGPQSVFDRENAKAGKGKAGDPSITGVLFCLLLFFLSFVLTIKIIKIVQMAYTINNKPVNMRGTYWMQESRVTSIKYLKNHVYTALMKYMELNKGAVPTNIVIYRGGVSEGDYQKVYFLTFSTNQNQFFLI
jgi:hypothetical protein